MSDLRSVNEAEVAGKRVLVRVDFNVPLKDGNGAKVVADDTRIRAALPTIELLRERGARIILVSHLGRPKGTVDPDFSMAPVAVHLANLLSEGAGGPVSVDLAPEVVGPQAQERAESLLDGQVLLLENSRFEPGETANDAELARRLAGLADLYVNDAFGAAHRAHATTEGVARLLPASAGLLLQRELEELGRVVTDPKRPLVVVLGGAKVTDKIGVIDRFLELADSILIGGAMCFSFFRAQGLKTGDSLVEEEGVKLAAEALERATASDCDLRLPVDLVIGDRFDAAADTARVDGVEVPDGWMGLDVGPRTGAEYAEVIAAAGTVLWNGPMGAFEMEPFAGGTRAVAEAVAAAPGITVIGGGDSVAALKQFGLDDRVDWLSTGGGASLELLEGRDLPGVAALSGP